MLVTKGYKAHRTLPDDEVEERQIYIEGEFPDGASLESAAATFEANAADLEDALYRSLPGGTYDRLLGRMLERKATHFVVSHAA